MPVPARFVPSLLPILLLAPRRLPDESATLFLVAIGVAFPIYINTYHGVRSVDAGLIEMSQTMASPPGSCSGR